MNTKEIPQEPGSFQECPVHPRGFIPAPDYEMVKARQTRGDPGGMSQPPLDEARGSPQVPAFVADSDSHALRKLPFLFQFYMSQSHNSVDFPQSFNVMKSSHSGLVRTHDIRWQTPMAMVCQPLI